MRLIALSEFRNLIYAPGSAPSLRTLQRRIDEIPGGMRLAGRYYVDLDEFDKKTRKRQKLEERKAEIASNPLMQGLF